MLPALWDYFQYRFQLRHYSAAALEKESGRLALAKNFPDLGTYQGADLFFLHGRVSWLSWGVMYYTSSVWSHTGLFSGPGVVIDARTDGVVEHSLLDYCDGASYIMLARNTAFTDEQRTRMVGYARSKIGAGFNWPGILRFWLLIVTGRHRQYRLRYSLDILLVLAAFLPLGFWWPITIPIVATIGGLYIVVVAVNILMHRWKAAEWPR